VMLSLGLRPQNVGLALALALEGFGLGPEVLTLTAS